MPTKYLTKSGETKKYYYYKKKENPSKGGRPLKKKTILLKIFNNLEQEDKDKVISFANSLITRNFKKN